MSDKNNSLILGIALIAGAFYYTRRQGTVRATPAITGVATMPGSVGTGTSQPLGGAIGNLLARMTGGGTATGAPVTLANPPYLADTALNNTVADPLAPYFSSTGTGYIPDPTQAPDLGFLNLGFGTN